MTVGLSISRRCAGREPEQAERGPDGVPQGCLHAEREDGAGPGGVGRACAQLAAGLLLVKLLLRWGSLWGSLQLAGSASPRFGLFLLGLGVGEGFL